MICYFIALRQQWRKYASYQCKKKWWLPRRKTTQRRSSCHCFDPFHCEDLNTTQCWLSAYQTSGASLLLSPYNPCQYSGFRLQLAFQHPSSRCESLRYLRYFPADQHLLAPTIPQSSLLPKRPPTFFTINRKLSLPPPGLFLHRPTNHPHPGPQPSTMQGNAAIAIILACILVGSLGLYYALKVACLKLAYETWQLSRKDGDVELMPPPAA